jgi:hypothetical protein
MASTPGRLQYYRAEMDPFLPDEYRWGLRLPNQYAVSNPKATYRNKIEEEIQRFLNDRIGSNYFDHKKGLNLNVTVQEAEFLIESTSILKKSSDSGELHDLHKQCDELEEKLNKQMDEVHEHFETLIQQINVQENRAYENLSKNGITGYRPHGDTSLFDVLGSSSGDASANNFQVCQNQAHGFDHHIQSTVDT